MVRKLIAANQLVGGVVGIALFLYGILFGRSATESLPALVLWACEIFLYGVAVCAGYALLRNDPRGYRLSLAVQACQLLRFTSPYVAYVFTCGTFLTYTFAPYAPGGKSDIRFALGAELPADSPLSIGVNAIAALSLLWLIRSLQALKTRSSVPSRDQPDRNVTAPDPSL
ncbi:MAG: hypothetical protein LAO05_09325 [Acidobacteriia bacterium]|nr:hypothetical protein [Terriglobia bacterium]